MARFPVVASFSFREGHHLIGKSLWLFLIREMPGAVDEFKPRTGNQRAIGTAIGLAEHAVVSAPQKQRRDADAVQPAFKPRIVEVRIPGNPRRRFARASRSEHL